MTEISQEHTKVQTRRKSYVVPIKSESIREKLRPRKTPLHTEDYIYHIKCKGLIHLIYNNKLEFDINLTLDELKSSRSVELSSTKFTHHKSLQATDTNFSFLLKESIMKNAIIACAITTLSLPSFAGFDEKGLSGEVSLLMGGGGETSNFNTDNKTSNGLNSKGQSASEFMAAPLGQLRYTFGSDNEHQVFAGTAREDIAVGQIALELGYAYALSDDSSLSLSVLPSIVSDETWQDPYLVGKERQTTDVSGTAYRIQYQGIYDTPWSAEFAFYDSKVDQENSGLSQLTPLSAKALQRTGSGIYAKTSYELGLTDNSKFEPAFIYQSFNADGGAMSYQKLGTDLSYMAKFGQHRYAATLNVSQTDYDAVNPLFNKTQKDTEYGMFVAYEYDQFFGMEDWAFNALAGYDVKSSNITFYDESEYMIGMGVAYSF